VLLDPHGWIPKRVQQQRDSEEWVAMAERDADVNVRREAVLSLAQLAATRAQVGGSSELSVNVSMELLAQDTSPSVRADAATALAVAGAATARTEIERAALEDPEARVRIAALRALATLGPDPGLARLAEDAFAAGFSWGTMGAAAALLAQADPGRAFDWLRANLELDSPHDSLAAICCASSPRFRTRACSTSYGAGRPTTRSRRPRAPWRSRCSPREPRHGRRRPRAGCPARRVELPRAPRGAARARPAGRSWCPARALPLPRAGVHARGAAARRGVGLRQGSP
jgi:hypothetical protein